MNRYSSVPAVNRTDLPAALEEMRVTASAKVAAVATEALTCPAKDRAPDTTVPDTPAAVNTPLAAPAAPVAATAPAGDTAGGDAASHPGAVVSPMVGTVYTAPEPGADDFVSAGTVVKKGQTLLIVEAMKVMNPITAPADGTVSQVLVQNAQPVEFGEALVIIE